MSKSGKGPWRGREGQRRTIGTGDRVFRAGFLQAGVKPVMGWNAFEAQIHGSEKVPPRNP